MKKNIEDRIINKIDETDGVLYKSDVVKSVFVDNYNNIKERIIKIISSILINYFIKNNNFDNNIIRCSTDIVNGVINYMNSDSYYQSHWKEFITYTNKLDEIRNESVFNIDKNLQRFM